MKSEHIVSGLSGVKGYALEVSNPVSAKPSEALQNAPRLGDLKGKTICEWISRRQQVPGVSKPGEPASEVGHWRETEVFPVIEELLKRRFPDIKIIPGAELPCYEDFGALFERKLSQQEKLDDITTAMKEKGCDAVILGNGA